VVGLILVAELRGHGVPVASLWQSSPDAFLAGNIQVSFVFGSATFMALVFLEALHFAFAFLFMVLPIRRKEHELLLKLVDTYASGSQGVGQQLSDHDKDLPK